MPSHCGQVRLSESAEMLRYVPVLVLTLVPVTLQAQEPAKPAGDKITYEQHIQPIFREKCGTCHNSNDKNGDLALDSYQGAMAGGASGEVVRVDGDAMSSPLYRVVAHLSEPFMPPEQPKLPDAQLELIKKWIEQGALQNAGSPARPKTANVARVQVSGDRPAGPPPMPEKLPIEPLHVSARANGVTAIATNPWSTLAAVAGHQQILLYDVATLELVGVLPFPEGQAHVLKFSRNGSLLMAGGGRGAHSGKVVLFDVRTGQREAEVGDEYDVVLAADVSPDHTIVALGGPKKIVRCYNVATGELLYELKKHTDWVTTLEFSPDGVLLATGDRSNGVIVWEAPTGREFYTLNGHTAAITDVSWAPDSNTLATASEDATVRLWEMQNGNQVKNWSAHGGGTLSIDFSRDARIVTSGRDLRAKSWDSSGNAQKTFEPPLPELATACALSVDCNRILAGDLLGNISVYSADDAKKVGELTTNPAPVAVRLEAARKEVSEREAAAAQAGAQVAALKKGIADRKAAAEEAQKTAAAAMAAVAAATQAKAAADQDVKVKQDALAKAQAEVQAKDAARNQAAANTEAVNKRVNELKAQLVQRMELAIKDQESLKKAQEAATAAPDDEALKGATESAAKAAATSAAQVTETNTLLSTAAKELATRNDEQIAATTALNTAKTNFDAANAAKAAAEKLVAETAAQLKSATELAAARKADAEKAVAAANVTPEQQKQLADAEAAAKLAAESTQAAKAKLDRLQTAMAASK